MEKLILDIGCGGNAIEAPATSAIRGNINCDIHKPKIKIENFIQCYVHHLPFRENTFSKIFCNNVLGHQVRLKL
jgi:hypothetical protein